MQLTALIYDKILPFIESGKCVGHSNKTCSNKNAIPKWGHNVLLWTSVRMGKDVFEAFSECVWISKF